MLEGRVVWLSDSDFIPALRGDESVPVMGRLKDEALDAALLAKVVLWQNQVVKNVFGEVGEISRSYSDSSV